MLGMTPFYPPKLGEKPYLEKDSLFGHSLFRVFLEAIDFAFKKCHFIFVPKAEQLQAIHVVVTGNDGFVKPATGFGKSVCYMVVPLICLRFSFDPSPMLIVNQSFLS